MGHFGFGVCRPWNDQVREFVTAEEQGVADDQACPKVRHVCKLVFADNFIHCVHIRIGGLHAVVDLDAQAFIVFDAGVCKSLNCYWVEIGWDALQPASD